TWVPATTSNSSFLSDLTALTSANINGWNGTIYNDVNIVAGTTDAGGNFTANPNGISLDLPAPRVHNRRIYLSWDSTLNNVQLVSAPYGSLPEIDEPATRTAFTTGNLALQIPYTR